MTVPNEPFGLSGAVLAPATVSKETISRDGVEVSETISLLEEHFQVAKREIVTGLVRVSTRTESVEQVAEVTLDRNRVDVTRVPVGQIVEVAPQLRTEGDTTIVPVVEERFVVVKQLFLKEELHIRHVVEQEVSSTPVQLRKQIAVVERLDAEGRVVSEPVIPSV